AIRSRSYDCLREQLSLAQPHQTLRILDLGAGNCWLSLRLARLGHKVIAVDVNDDMLDGLGALKRLNTETADITPVKAEFNYLPFPEQSFDIIIFNASLHYSLEPYRLLFNTLRFLKNTGILFILDSPIYQNESGGQAMLKEKVESFKREHGIELTDGYAGSFLTIPKLEQLKESYRVEIITPSYNVLWKLRPYLARLKGAREPATFALVKLKKNIES
ncbi:MAG TPA: class I SAM-dependent methyltransferase, partial [Bacteroidota bacterium]